MILIPSIPAAAVPAVTTEQMREVDRAMIVDFGIALVQMMENAGRNLAELARFELGGRIEGQPIVVLAGPGNNGGGGMAAALDTPSGLDTTSGKVYDPCIRARATLMLALPKTGLLQSTARRVVGELFLADISVPAQVYTRMGLVVPDIFAEASLVRIIQASTG